MVKLPADFLCPYKECGRKGGSVRLKIVRVKIPKKREKPVTTTDFSTNHKETKYVERSRHFHPYRWMHIFGISHPYERPRINPPKPEPRVSLPYLACARVRERLMIFRDMIPFVLRKHPWLEPIIADMYHPLVLINRNSKSIVDDRHRRSAAEWALIAKVCREHGPNAASRKYPGITTDGKLECLSPKYIKRKAAEAEAYWVVLQFCHLFLKACCGIAMNVIMNDPELAALYGDHRVKYEIEIGKEVKQLQKAIRRSATGRKQRQWLL